MGTDAVISLIVPMYNAGRYLKSCLASVEAQTFKRFECLCVDDGSADATATIARAFAARDMRFKLVGQSHAGCSAARNRGLALASAPCVAFLDADDLLHPQMFEIAHTLIERHRADAVSFGHAEVTDDFVLAEPVRHPVDAVSVTVADSPFASFFNVSHGKVKIDSPAVWSHFYRRAAIAGIAFPEGVHFAEDAAFVLKVMSAVRRRVMTPAVLFFHRNNPDSAMNQGVTREYIRSHAGAVRDIRAYFAQHAPAPRESALIRRYLSNVAYKAGVSQPIRKVRSADGGVVLSYARQMVSELAAEGCFDTGDLGVRKKISTYCFLHDWLGLARWLA